MGPLIVLLIFILPVFGTVSSSVQQANASPEVHVHLPGAMLECEDTAGCATWFFRGNKGYGQWKNGSIANLTVENLNASSISILRVDTSGTVAGLRAHYVGTRSGDSFVGQVTWSWPGHGQYSTGMTNWHVSIGALPQSSNGSAVSGKRPLPITQSPHAGFTKAGCPNTPPANSTNSAFDAFRKGRAVQLDTADQSTDLEAVRWFCRAAELGSGQAAFAIGELYDTGFLLPSVRDNRGLRSDSVPADMAIALSWYRKAADLGNSDGMLKIASFYFAGDMIKGNPVARDVPQAITSLKQAAHLGDTDAMESLAVVYLLGIPDPVTPVSPDLSKLAIVEKNEGAQQDWVRSSCHNATSEVQRLTPEHEVKEVIGVAAHSDSYTCMATFAPGEDEYASIAQWLKPMLGQQASWTYIVYLRTDKTQTMEWLTRIPEREEFFGPATGFALAVGASLRN
jgi:hypothetical protein